MGIALKTHKMLWGRSGNRCAIENCRKVLVYDVSETDGDISVLGEEAHIVARELSGPRGASELPIEARDKYSNLILLCHDHHKIIDDNPEGWPVEKLNAIKQDHEIWVRSTLGSDPIKERDDENYSSYVDKVLELCNISDWGSWSSRFYANSEHIISRFHHGNLESLPGYLNSRIWPRRYVDLENAFENLGLIGNDLLFVFDEHRVEYKPLENYRVERFYKIERFPQELYNSLLQDYRFHVAFICDLFQEFTRALNLLFDLVRKYLFPSFRITEGALMLESGAAYNRLLRVEYKLEERNGVPYKGFKDFMSTRAMRDYCLGGDAYSDQYGQ